MKNHENVNGTYSVAYSAKGKITAFCDFSGLSPLFYFKNEYVTAVSNRQFLLALSQQTEHFQYNLEALSWLPGQASIIREEAFFSGVKKLVPGTYIEIGKNVSIHEFREHVWSK
ncbi:hypothetical protein BKP37_14780 [Anaerobacillus alkalilacustris]|uniref:Glutamine amidotransferase type-2 domain-containing protein n=1 Tax=Anaerobacillus alkalilacustris TaxID=393763 RepID=A0A1S2LJ42_9BACI|nr:hypothetical protein [Anaerobacillus alkalilacustris]OIJ11707.1 hypothetical protein BKP37_14780 [Anaerobacillus alkalilacustris]